MERLFVYGTLQPGGPNEHVLTNIGGNWEPAVVKGRLIEAGWGAGMGYPGLILDENGNDIHGHVFISSNLNDKWAYLDEFEGKEYERTVTSVILPNGKHIQAYVYVLQNSQDIF